MPPTPLPRSVDRRSRRRRSPLSRPRLPPAQPPPDTASDRQPQAAAPDDAAMPSRGLAWHQGCCYVRAVLCRRASLLDPSSGSAARRAGSSSSMPQRSWPGMSRLPVDSPLCAPPALNLPRGAAQGGDHRPVPLFLHRVDPSTLCCMSNGYCKGFPGSSDGLRHHFSATPWAAQAQSPASRTEIARQGYRVHVQSTAAFDVGQGLLWRRQHASEM